MRQASWNEMFSSRAGEPFVLAPEMPEEPTGWRRLLWWEDWLTFLLLSVVYLSVVASIQTAGWVEDMPSLFPIAFFGLVLAALLARLPWLEGFVHLLALSLGAAAILGQLLIVATGSSPVQRFENITTRMGEWFSDAFSSGINNDSLPFIIVVVSLTWLAAYLSAWAVFRWQNAWLGLLPGGSALLVNLGVQSAGFSVAVVCYLFASALLLARLHLLQEAKAWRKGGTPYPPLLSLSVLHATFWAAFLLLGLAWILPQAQEVRPLEAAWERATEPIVGRMADLSRLFVSVRGGGGEALLLRYGNVLPFRGEINLSNEEILELLTEQFDQPLYLRGDVYQVYTPEGWLQKADQTLHLRANVDIGPEDEAQRNEVIIQVIPAGNTAKTIFTVGQPSQADRRTEARAGTNNLADIISLESQSSLSAGQAYKASGSVSTATEDELRRAGTNYPFWVRERYLDLPQELPYRVGNLARSIAANEDNPYDQATAIERYLRENYEYTFDVPDVPYGRDAVDFFLFESKQGYFDYFASAMVVMLRANGIPSRLVIGYALPDGAEGPGGERFVVTDANAFAWAEAYFPGYGWVEFNPSPAPGLGPIRRPSGRSLDLPEPSERAASGNLDLRGLAGLFPEDDPTPGAALPTTGGAGNGRWVLLGVLLGLAATVLSIAGGVRFAWARGLSGLDQPARLWGQTQRLASWARVPVDRTQTPREFARRLRDEVPGTEPAELLAEAYVRHRYGRANVAEPDEATRTRLEDAWRSVRGSLLRRLFRLS